MAVLTGRHRVSPAVEAARLATFLFLALLSESCGRDVAGRETLRFDPGRHQVVRSEAYDQPIDIEYRVTNESTHPIDLDLVSKSCECVKVEVRPVAPLVPGASATVTLTGHVPASGRKEASVVFRDRGSVDAFYKLSYSLLAARPPGLQVVPARYRLKDTSSSQVLAITANYCGRGLPGRVFAETAAGANPIVTPISAWKRIEGDDACWTRPLEVLLDGPTLLEDDALPWTFTVEIEGTLAQCIWRVEVDGG